MGIYAITGCATGIGAATRAGLEAEGHTIIGIDLKDAEIIADLSTPGGRSAAIESVKERAPDGLDGLIACAGVGPQFEPLTATVSINYYGTVELLEALKDLVAAKRGVIALIASNSAPLPGLDEDLVSSMLDGDEARSHTRISELDNGHQAYAGSKLALVRWMRRKATEWAKDGIRMNAVAPGVTMTPLLEGGLAHPVWGDAIRNFPIPMGDFADPGQIASVVLFLVGPGASYCCGSVIFVDGGSDAMIRPDGF